MQAAAFVYEVAEDVILKRSVLGGSGNAAANVFLIDLRGLWFWRIAESERAEVADLEFLGDAALLLVVFEDLRDEREIAVEGWGQGSDAGLLHVTLQYLFLEGD